MNYELSIEKGGREKSSSYDRQRGNGDRQRQFA